MLDDRPNVLVIMTDDQRPSLMSVMPQTRRWITNRGTEYTQAFTPDPVCCPARTSMMTGRYAHNHGVLDIGMSENLNHDTTIQHYLRDVGYRTALVGKYLIDWDVNEPPPHFDEWAVRRSGNSPKRANYYGAEWNVNGTVRKVGTYSTHFVHRRSLKFLQRAESDDAQPWLLYATPSAPHSPMIPSPRYRDARVPKLRLTPRITERGDRSDKPVWVQDNEFLAKWATKAHRQQARTLLSVDDMIGHLMSWLERNGELDNTLVVFTSDNGFLLGEHRSGRKGLPYTASIQVPLAIRWTDQIPDGSQSNDLTSLVDIAPTILDAAGLMPPPTEPMDGRSLLATYPAREDVLIEFDARWHIPSWRSLRSLKEQFVEWYDYEGNVIFQEHYDLTTDPMQNRNILMDGDEGNDPDVAALSAELERASTCAGLTCP